MSVANWIIRVTFLITIFKNIYSSSNGVLQYKMQKMEEDQFTPSFSSHKMTQHIEGHLKLEDTTILDLTRIKDGLFTIKISIGEPKQDFNVLVDTGSFLLWVASKECNDCYFNKNLMDIKLSKTLHKKPRRISLRYVSGAIEGFESHDILSIHDRLTTKKFRFLLSDTVNARVNVDGILGFSRQYEPRYSTQFSIIETLKNSGVINHRIFSQKIGDSENDSMFTIGEMPEEITKNIEKYSFCNAVTNNPSVNSFWTCNLKQVLIQDFRNEKSKSFNQTIEISNEPSLAIFDTGSNVIIAPTDLYDNFKNYYFREFLESKTCFTLEDYSGSNGIQCKGDTNFEAFPSILFVFDNNKTYEIHTKHLFAKSGEDAILRIVFSSVPGNGWLLGEPFLREFHTVFDMDNNTIGMYHAHKYIPSIHELQYQSIVAKKSFDLGFYVYITAATVMLVGILIFVIFKLVKKNKKVQFEEDNRVDTLVNALNHKLIL